VNVAVQAPSSNMTEIMEAFEGITDDGNIYAGFAPGAAVSGGIHLGAFSNKLKGILAPISTEHIFSLKLVETGGNYESDCPHETDKRKTQRRDGPATIAG
ncbi:hypothetical protein, partial [Vibrio sp.]|uniref:hypothetical protein n=1 Tax=Vibrio sp. TaxID=678 RepID=UPI003D0A0D47